MKTPRALLLCALISCLLTPCLYADRQLTQAEIDSLLSQLVENTSDGWITSGSVKAKHVEYQAPKTTDVDWVESRIKEEIAAYLALDDKPQLTEETQKDFLEAIPFNVRHVWLNEYTQVTQEEVAIRGGRYHYQIEIIEREDSIIPTGTLVDNIQTNHVRLPESRLRSFYWDGQAYTRYYHDVANAVIEDQDMAPELALAPLLAGFISWGQGDLSLVDLQSAKILAQETSSEGQTVVDLTLALDSGVTYTMTLDPALDYAPLEWQGIQLNWMDRSVCSDYVQVGERWVPTTIYIEHQDLEGRLLNSHRWALSVSAVTPVSSRFQAQLATNTHVMRTNPQSTGPLYYYHNVTVDPEMLLAERLAVVNENESLLQNCASVHLRYAIEQLGKTLDWTEATDLVASDGLTSLLDMTKIAQGLGINARAVILTWEEMEALEGVQAILYRPGKGHFVLLDYVNTTEAWVIDLTSNTFYRPLKKAHFGNQDEFIVLLLSNDQALEINEQAELSLDVQASILGGEGYDGCTIPNQISMNPQQCIEVNMVCSGKEIQYFWYYQCEDVPDCYESPYLIREWLLCPSDCKSWGTVYPVVWWACDGEYPDS